MQVFKPATTADLNYATLNIGRKLAVTDAPAAFVEWLAIGTIIGLVYKPAQKSVRQLPARYD
ncbi:MAG TPA: hypothetical protein VFI56_26135 [Vicinamibacterales bacterium]|nr:hypothetical protein [Vicinamibacterales bacterium]